MKKIYLAIIVLVAVLALFFFVLNSKDSNLNGLDGKSWQLVKVVYSDGKEVVPTKEDDFALTLGNDNTFTLDTDCNNMGGEYSVEGNLISFQNVFSTKMYCEGSKEGEVSQALEKAKIFYYNDDGSLVIDLEMDSGSVYFR